MKLHDPTAMRENSENSVTFETVQDRAVLMRARNFQVLDIFSQIIELSTARQKSIFGNLQDPSIYLLSTFIGTPRWLPYMALNMTINHLTKLHQTTKTEDVANLVKSNPHLFQTQC